MKSLKTIFSVLALIAAVSCGKSRIEGEGRVEFEVSSNQDVTDVTKSNVSDYTALPAAEDFTLAIFDESDAQVWTGKISDWDSDALLPAGSYTVEASYGNLEDEGFDKPYFTGSQTFMLKGGETVNVPVPVSLGNTIIRISCSKNFNDYYKDYTFRLTRDGSEIASFVKGETRGAFIDGYKIKVEGFLAGEVKNYVIEKEYKSLDEATAYTMYFDAPGVGGSEVTITFNDNVETVDLGEYELND